MPDDRAVVGRRRATRTLLAVAAAAAALATILTIPQVVYEQGDVSVLLRVGTYAPRDYVEQDFTDPVLTPDYGHDGQQFYVVVENLPDLQAAAPFVDHLPYRARRILFPAIVAPLPAGVATVWGMYVVNLVAVGFAAAAVGLLARRLRLTPWLGLSVGLSPAFVESTMGSLADTTAFALALWAIVLWRRKLGWAIVLFTLAALTRETSLTAALACAVVAHGWTRLKLLTPVAVYGAWAVLVSRLFIDAHPEEGGGSIVGDVARLFSPPFGDWHVGTGIGRETLFLVLLAGCSLVAAWRLRERLPELSVWLCLDVVMLIVANDTIVSRILNSARVIPLAVPAIAITFALERRERGVRSPSAGDLGSSAAPQIT